MCQGKCKTNLPIPSQTSSSAPLKGGNGWVILSNTLQWMWLLIPAWNKWLTMLVKGSKVGSHCASRVWVISRENKTDFHHFQKYAYHLYNSSKPDIIIVIMPECQQSHLICQKGSTTSSEMIVDPKMLRRIRQRIKRVASIVHTIWYSLSDIHVDVYCFNSKSFFIIMKKSGNMYQHGGTVRRTIAWEPG